VLLAEFIAQHTERNFPEASLLPLTLLFHRSGKNTKGIGSTCGSR
jgi:hypothetical protein